MDSQSGGASGPGIMPPPGFFEQDSKIPARVGFSLDIVHWANQIEKGNSERSYDGGPVASEGARPLRDDEKAVYGAALEVMRLYLAGEMSFDGEFDEDDDEIQPQKSQSQCFFCGR